MANEGIIYKVTRSYSSTSEDQKDLYQEIIFQLWRSYDKFRNESKKSTWLYRVALNTALTFSQRKKRDLGRELISVELFHKYNQTLEAKDDRIQLLYEHIQRLKPVNRAIMLLHLEGNDYEEIASIMGVTSTNVGTRLNRIRKKLKSQILNRK